SSRICSSERSAKAARMRARASSSSSSRSRSIRIPLRTILTHDTASLMRSLLRLRGGESRHALKRATLTHPLRILHDAGESAGPASLALDSDASLAGKLVAGNRQRHVLIDPSRVVDHEQELVDLPATSDKTAHSSQGLCLRLEIGDDIPG